MVDNICNMIKHGKSVLQGKISNLENMTLQSLHCSLWNIWKCVLSIFYIL